MKYITLLGDYIQILDKEQASKSINYRSKILGEILDKLQIVEVSKNQCGLVQIEFGEHKIPVFINLCWRDKTQRLFISIKTYKHIKSNGHKEGVIKKNCLEKIKDNNNNLGFYIPNILERINDVITPIIFKNTQDKIINEQILYIRELHHTMVPNSLRKNTNIRYMSRGDKDSKMGLEINNLDDKELQFILSMLCLVSN